MRDSARHSATCRRAIATLVLVLALAAAAPAEEAKPAAPKPAPKPAAPAIDPAAERAAAREALVHAYQKEYTFLADEERALQARLAEVQADHARRAGEAQTELTALEERLRTCERDLEARRARLAKVDEQASGGDDTGEALAAILAQAGGVVPGFDGVAPEPAGVDRALAAVVGSLRDRGSIRKVAGVFFLPSGAEARGDVVWIGSVACLGASAQGAGALVPAGSGALQLWSPEGGDGSDARAAREAAAGRLPDVLPLYVFESLDKAVEQKAKVSLAAYISRGGDVAWVIVSLGCVTVLLVLTRIVILTLARGDPDPLLAQVVPLVESGRRDQALALARGWRGSAARVVEAMLPQLGHGAERLEGVAAERTLAQLQRLERFETAILVTASISPLLGLLGTVTGMISTFDVITLFGSGDPKLLAGGISEALVATAMGLYVAIPAVLLGNALSTWTEGLRAGMERAALRLLLVEAEMEERRLAAEAMPAPARARAPRADDTPEPAEDEADGRESGVEELAGAGAP